jgi:hypothetical protein
MRWVKLGDHVWISERETGHTTSRIKEIDGVFYASGENNHTLVQKSFSSLKDAKKWVRDCTGWDGH